VLHLDLKPQNILLFEDGTAKICDFGTSKLLGEWCDDTTSPGQCTYRYAAPEVLQKNVVSVQTDLYSFGCVMLELITGKAPLKHLIEPGCFLRWVNDNGTHDLQSYQWPPRTEALQKLIASLLSFSPDERGTLAGAVAILRNGTTCHAPQNAFVPAGPTVLVPSPADVPPAAVTEDLPPPLVIKQLRQELRQDLPPPSHEKPNHHRSLKTSQLYYRFSGFVALMLVLSIYCTTTLFSADETDQCYGHDSQVTDTVATPDSADPEAIALLSTLGGDVTETLLLASALCGVKVVETLVRLGADVRAISGRGVTPLHAAAKNGNVAVIELLASLGGSVNAKDSSGTTPLHAAAARGHTAAIEALTSRGADVRAVRNNGATAMHAAARNGHAAVIEQLFMLDVDLDAKRKNGATPLHAAARNCQLLAIQALVKLGANVQAITNHGATARMLAEGVGCIAAINILCCSLRCQSRLSLMPPFIYLFSSSNRIVHMLTLAESDAL
jgi:hypothetical protein